MKKIIIAIGAIAAVFTMASCGKEQPTKPESPIVVGNDIITAYAESKLTKTSLSGSDLEGYEVRWSAGDKITIGGNQFSLTEGENTTYGKFRGSLPKEDGEYTACYPASYNGTDWPSPQTYTEGNIIGSPMKASVTISGGKVSEESVSFKNSGGILRLTLKGTATVYTIVVSATDMEEVYLNCAGGVSLDNMNGKVFHIALPAGSYSELLLQFKTIDGLDIEKQMKPGKQLVIERSKITDVSLSGINSTAPAGILPGKFSVAEGRQVYFSRGNLRYTVDSFTWSFFDKQYDCGPSAYDAGHDKEISLFTWGFGRWSRTTDTKEYLAGYEDGTDFRLTQDWGPQIGNWGAWRTLTKAEWDYLFTLRSDADKKYGYATVCGAKGLIILPDTFIDPDKNGGSGAFKPQSSMSSWTDNVYSSGGNWETMEYAGAVFLPAAGGRDGSDISSVGNAARYWSSTAADAGNAYSVYFDTGNSSDPSCDLSRSSGCSVRLVTGTYTVTFDSNGKPGTVPQSIEGLLYGSSITKPADSPATEGYTFTGWYKEPECRNLWDFEMDYVTASTTLYAGWSDALLSGKFTVAEGRQVYFSRGNLWADGSNVLHFENNQWGFNSSYSSSHVSHFTWSSEVSGAAGTSGGSGGYLFCDKNHKVSVDGSAPIYYALTKDEWTYLLNLNGSGRRIQSGQKPTYTIGIRYSDGKVEKEGLVIYPDDYSGDSLTPGEGEVYTEDTFPKDCVFLPGAGWRDGNNIRLTDRWDGFYWTSSAETGQKTKPNSLGWTSGSVSISEPGNAANAMSIRLVTTVE